MRRTAQTRRFTAKALRNPKPGYVSLVKGGANQTPFKKVAADPAVSGSPTPKENDDMKVTRSVDTVAPKGFGIMNFTFNKEKFADEADVKAWLDNGGYADYEIVETTKAFEVSDNETKFENASARKIALDEEGIVAFVGKLDGSSQKADEDATAAAEAAAAAAEPGDGTADGEPVVDTEPDATSGPEIVDATDPADAPAADAVDAAAEAAADTINTSTGETRPSDTAGVVIEAELAGKIDAIAEAFGVKKGTYAVSEIGTVVRTLAYLVADAEYIGFSDGVVGNLKKAAKASLAAFVDAASDAAAEYAEIVKSDPTVATKSEAAPAAEEPAETDLADIVRSAVEAAVKPVQDAIAATTQGLSEVREEVTSTKSVLDERVTALETRGQTRKASGEPEVTTADKKPEESRTRSNLLGAFGSRHSRDA